MDTDHFPFFPETSRKHTIRQLLDFPLKKAEEDCMISFFKEQTLTEGICQNFLFLYFVNRGRYTEAIQENERLKQQISSPENLQTRDLIVQNIFASLPEVQRQVLDLAVQKKMFIGGSGAFPLCFLGQPCPCV